MEVPGTAMSSTVKSGLLKFLISNTLANQGNQFITILNKIIILSNAVIDMLLPMQWKS